MSRGIYCGEKASFDIRYIPKCLCMFQVLKFNSIVLIKIIFLPSFSIEDFQIQKNASHIRWKCWEMVIHWTNLYFELHLRKESRYLLFKCYLFPHPVLVQHILPSLCDTNYYTNSPFFLTRSFRTVVCFAITF